MECVELAPAFEPRHTSDSGSKLHALHTLRETRPPLSSVCAICSVSPENLGKKQDFRLYYSARRRKPKIAVTEIPCLRHREAHSTPHCPHGSRRPQEASKVPPMTSCESTHVGLWTYGIPHS